ncbi:hypothetical protein Tco_1501614 [Tanacetum coccineum]
MHQPHITIKSSSVAHTHQLFDIMSQQKIVTWNLMRDEGGDFESWVGGFQKLLEYDKGEWDFEIKCDKAPIVIEKDNPKVKAAVVKEKPADVTTKVSKGKELDVLKYKHKIEKESNALDNLNESDKGPVSESHEIQSESHEIQSESHVNHMEMQRKTKPDVVKAPVAKAKADVVKAPVAKDNHMGFKMNYM